MSNLKHVYLDYCATTPVDPDVIEVMLPYFNQDYGNPSSVHRFGQRAEAALEQARADIADCLNCLPEEIYFTSGGSESNNLAIRGSAFESRKRSGKDHLITTGVEHPAVLQTVIDLNRNFGYSSSVVGVNSYGMVEMDELERLLTDRTILVSAICANNEIGTINPIQEMALLCHKKGVLFHTDAVQAAGLLKIDLKDLPVDLLSIGAHKFYGPKGVGVLFIRRGTPIQPIQTGGSHERGFRAGTSNIPYIVGMAAALKIAVGKRNADSVTLSNFRDHLIQAVQQSIPNAILTGHPIERLPNHASFVFPGVDGNILVALLDHAGFACSSGSACKTGDPQPSEVLIAIGIDPETALGSLRVSIGRETLKEEIDSFCQVLPDLVTKAKLR